MLLPALSCTTTYKGAASLAGCATPMAGTCQDPVTLPVVATLEKTAVVVAAAVWLVTARPM